MGRFANFRRIMGMRFSLANPRAPFETKARARKSADAFRRNGWMARMFKVKGGYNVYVRKGRRRKR